MVDIAVSGPPDDEPESYPSESVQKLLKLSSVGAIAPEKPNIWWVRDRPSEIYMTMTTKAMVNEHGGQHGFWTTFSTNLKSANYDPANFNRLARWLESQGIDAPPQVPVGSRRLGTRFKNWHK
jgi:hypothetical protein